MSTSEVVVAGNTHSSVPATEGDAGTPLPATLPRFLKQRAVRQTHRFLKALAEVNEAESAMDRDTHWPDQRWGIGQDGSILGIVSHVAAWKEMTLPLLTPGGQAISREELETRPLPMSWSDVCVWYSQVSNQWLETVAALPEAVFSEMIVWEGHSWAIGAIIAEVVEHDVQHAAQIEYLLQQHRARAAAP